MPFNALGLPLEYCSSQVRQQSKMAQTSSQILWSPKDPENTSMSRYRQHINKKFSQNLKTSHDLHRWSVTEPHAFWIDLHEYTGIIPPLPSGTTQAYDSNIPIRDKPVFFTGHELNYAENVLVPNLARFPHDIALTGLRENQLDDPENVTWTALGELVRITRSALVRQGIKQTDVVAVVLSNSIWIVVIFLATASIGAYFTSISPDMGVAGCTSRLTQVNPKLLLVDTDYALRGVRHSLSNKVQQILAAFTKASASPPRVIFVPTTHKPHLHRHVDYVRPIGITLFDFLTSASSRDRLTFTRVPTNHPLVILYSSGTTGTPKCILSPHMSILNFKKIAYLHNSLDHTSTVFQYSSTSWVVWNIMLGHLSVGARLITYDGGALYPSPATLLQICQDHKVTYWGTSPRYLLELEQAKASAGIDPHDFDLSHMKMVTTTGATLTGPQMRWFYTAFPKSIHLSSIAGGTEIASSWIASDPAGPIRENEMQMWALGHDCDILDPVTGKSVMTITTADKPDSPREEIGELVCKKTFPSVPVGFWNDPNDAKWRATYFEQFPISSPSSSTEQQYLDVWSVNDITTHNPSTRGLQITARSDSTLNPSGIRFGPSEIYAILSSSSSSTDLKSRISDSLCVGRKRTRPPHADRDETVFLFVAPSASHGRVDEKLIGDIKSEIARGLSPRHVPKFIIEVPLSSSSAGEKAAIPYTVNGKKVEVLVKKIISGDVDVDQRGNIVGKGKGTDGGGAGAVSTIVNPECLYWYRRFKDVERAVKGGSEARDAKL